MTNKLVLYSSGYDSTLMLLEQLQINNVAILYIAGRQCPRKTAVELTMIRRLITYLRVNPQPFTITGFHFIANPISSLSVDAWIGGLNQPIQWMIGATMVPYFYHELLYGRIKGDDCSLYTDEINEFWLALQVITNRAQFMDLVTPLEYLTKREVILTLMEKYPFALKMITTCQLPVNIDYAVDKQTYLQPCGKCISCNSEKVTFLAIKKPFKRKGHMVQDHLLTACIKQFATRDSFYSKAWCEDAKLPEHFPFSDPDKNKDTQTSVIPEDEVLTEEGPVLEYEDDVA